MKRVSILSLDLFDNLSYDEWGTVLNNFNVTINYTSWFLKYIEALNAKSRIKNHTFVIYENDIPAVIVPIYIENIDNNWQISMGQEPIFAPVFNKNISKTEYNKYYDYLLTKIDNLANLFNCRLARFQYSPLLDSEYNHYKDFGFSENISYPDWYIFKAKFSYVIDLSQNIDELYRNVRKSNKPLINRTRRETKYFILDSSNFNQSVFDRYVELYLSVKGNKRSLSVFSLDAIAIKDGLEVLLVCEYNDLIVGAIALHTYNQKARYNSSVQDPKFDRLIYPIHFLLWQAILYLNEKDFDCFEIGEQVVSGDSVNDKEKNLSHFKAGWGGKLEPCLKIQKSYEYV